MKESNQVFWEELFGIRGCPAHTWVDNDGSCQKGYCCIKCPEKVGCETKCVVKEGILCSVGVITKHELLQIYKSRKWKGYPEFTRAVKERARHGKR